MSDSENNQVLRGGYATLGCPQSKPMIFFWTEEKVVTLVIPGCAASRGHRSSPRILPSGLRSWTPAPRSGPSAARAGCGTPLRRQVSWSIPEAVTINHTKTMSRTKRILFTSFQTLKWSRTKNLDNCWHHFLARVFKLFQTGWSI